MTTETVKSLFELVDERPHEDRTAIFDQLWHVLGELRGKLDAHFTLQPDASTASFQPYQSITGEAKGFLSGYTSPEIDWMVHSYIGNPKQSFTNMHLTVWLGPQVRAPHFGMALGTMPDIFMYIDYVPRADLVADLEYVDTYYEPANETYLTLRQDPEFSPFVSKSLYMRQSQSASSLCFLCKPTSENVAKIKGVAHSMLDRWIGYIRTAPAVPVAERPALAARDLHVRRAIAERDPANPMGERLFGKELSDRLVRGLWGGDRVNPHAGQEG